jgi:3-methyladenine DNA glycosylase AlkD
LTKTQNSDILRILQKLRPDHEFITYAVDEKLRDISKVINERAAELLRKDFGRPGFTSLTDSLENLLKSLGL